MNEYQWLISCLSLPYFVQKPEYPLQYHPSLTQSFFIETVCMDDIVKEMREIIAAQSRAIQDLTSTVKTLTNESETEEHVSVLRGGEKPSKYSKRRSNLMLRAAM